MTLNDHLKTRPAESWESWFLRWKLNFIPCYIGTGAKAVYLAADYQETVVSLPLSWRTRNVVGTIFGGSLYGAIDPIYMLMLMKILGADYIVWDKAASIEFLRPGQKNLTATFLITDEEIKFIKDSLQNQKAIERVYSVDLVDHRGVIYAKAQKTLYIRRRTRQAQKQGILFNTSVSVGKS